MSPKIKRFPTEIRAALTRLCNIPDFVHPSQEKKEDLDEDAIKITAAASVDEEKEAGEEVRAVQKRLSGAPPRAIFGFLAFFLAMLVAVWSIFGALRSESAKTRLKWPKKGPKFETSPRRAPLLGDFQTALKVKKQIEEVTAETWPEQGELIAFKIGDMTADENSLGRRQEYSYNTRLGILLLWPGNRGI